MNKSGFNKIIRKSVQKFKENKKPESRVDLYYDEEHAKAIIDIFLDGLVSAMEQEDEVSILNYFRISKRHRKARAGMNPKTGEAMNVPAYNHVAFKAGTKLKKACNPKPTITKKKSSKKR